MSCHRLGPGSVRVLSDWSMIEVGTGDVIYLAELPTRLIAWQVFHDVGRCMVFKGPFW